MELLEESIDTQEGIIAEIKIVRTTVHRLKNLSLGIIDDKTLKQQFHYQHDQ